jgi:hypothetical protein
MTAPARYILSMNANGPFSVSFLVKTVLGFALLAAATGLAFAAWLDQGAGIFMAMIDAGLAWCF